MIFFYYFLVVDDHDYCMAVEVLMDFNAWPLLYISCDCGGSSNAGFVVDVGDVGRCYY